MSYELIEAYDHIDDIRTLFAEYVAWLGISLDFQNYDAEAAALPGHYAEPDGRLYLLLVDGEPAGCVALRSFDTLENGARRCEMKRLYVRDQYKGKRLGRLLAERVVAEAKEIGYTEMLLDSFTFMEAALHLYERLGFQEIPSYRFNPYPNAKYMRLRLT